MYIKNRNSKITSVMLRVTNLSCSANLNTNLDLRELNKLIEGSEYKYPRFNGLIVHNQSPKCTIIYYGTGKVVIVGAKSEMEAESGAFVAYLLLDSCGIKCHLSDFKIHNIAAAGNLGTQIKINEFAKKYHKYVEYDTEIFPGAFLRHPNIKATIILFYQGNIILTGAKEKKEIEDGFKILKSMITPDLVRN